MGWLSLELLVKVVGPFAIAGVVWLLARWSGADTKVLFPVLGTAVIAVLGWYVGDYYAKERDRLNSRRELRTAYLVDAYRKIETLCAREDTSQIADEMVRDVERAIADIQLMGTPHQIELAKKIAKNVEETSYSDPRELLADLRSHLRNELDLEAVSDEPTDIMHFRIKQVLPNPSPPPKSP